MATPIVPAVGLTAREAARRLQAVGPNELEQLRSAPWWRDAGRQVTHPLALLLWAASVLCLLIDQAATAAAIVSVIVLNASLAVWQERQTSRAIELLRAYLPQHARVVRDGAEREILATALVPGDLMRLREGDRVSADGRLVAGAVQLDLSTVTGESIPVERAADAEDAVFCGTRVLAGEADALATATGMATQLGRIAALSHVQRQPPSPLERQVRRTAWLIAGVAAAAAAAFIPLGVLVAGLPLAAVVVFAIGLLVANVPEGLLPTITLSLAIGVRQLARRGTLVRRLSGVEALGSVSVICTDKTGTVTRNEMRPARVWTASGTRDLPLPAAPEPDETLAALAESLAVLGEGEADPTSQAVAAVLGLLAIPAPDPGRPLARNRFDPRLRMESRVLAVAGQARVHVSGAPESVLERCTRVALAGGAAPLKQGRRDDVLARVGHWGEAGLRVIAVALRRVDEAEALGWPGREEAERDLVLVGLIGLVDPVREGVVEAVSRCHNAGICVHLVTGDLPQTAAAVARQIGLGRGGLMVLTGEELERMPESSLDALLAAPGELVLARSTPEGKLRITDALRDLDDITAMTGDGVNDAPALRRADVGVAMGRSGTDVAREAATLVLADDNFATIVDAVEEGRRVYASVRKFIVYIFAHAPAEVVPLLCYALAGGRIPLPLTVVQILAIDVGTETLPAIALGREPAEPGAMQRPPRPAHEPLITGAMLRRAWLVLGGVSAVLVTAGYFGVLVSGGWSPDAPTGQGAPLHTLALQASTMTFLGIVACQVGVAMAVRADRESLWSVGLASNPWLLWGVLFELAFAAVLVAVPAVAEPLGMALPPWPALAVLPLFAVAVWGVDELARARSRRRARARSRWREGGSTADAGE